MKFRTTPEFRKAAEELRKALKEKDPDGDKRLRIDLLPSRTGNRTAVLEYISNSRKVKTCMLNSLQEASAGVLLSFIILRIEQAGESEFPQSFTPSKRKQLLTQLSKEAEKKLGVGFDIVGARSGDLLVYHEVPYKR